MGHVPQGTGERGQSLSEGDDRYRSLGGPEERHVAATWGTRWHLVCVSKMDTTSQPDSHPQPALTGRLSLALRTQQWAGQGPSPRKPVGETRNRQGCKERKNVVSITRKPMKRIKWAKGTESNWGGGGCHRWGVRQAPQTAQEPECDPCDGTSQEGTSHRASAGVEAVTRQWSQLHLTTRPAWMALAGPGEGQGAEAIETMVSSL